MTPMKRFLFSTAALAGVLVLVGCGGSGSSVGGGGGTAFLSGTVTQPGGSRPAGRELRPTFVPLANAPVSVIDLETDLVAASATTGTDGTYSVSTVLADGNYLIRAVGPNNLTIENVVTVDAGETGIDRDLDPLTTLGAQATTRQFRRLLEAAGDDGLADTIDLEDLVEDFVAEFEDEAFELPDFEDEAAIEALIDQLLTASTPVGVYGGTITGPTPGRLAIGVFNGDEAKILVVPPTTGTAAPMFHSFLTDVTDQGNVVVSSETFKLNGIIAKGTGTGVWKALNAQTGAWESGTWEIALQNGANSGVFEVQSVNAFEPFRPLTSEVELDLAFVLDDNTVLFQATSFDDVVVMGIGTVDANGDAAVTVRGETGTGVEGTGTLAGDDLNFTFSFDGLDWEIGAFRYTDFGLDED